MKAGRIGTKKRDMRFRSPDGQEWASSFEWMVYDAYSKSGKRCRRTIKGGSDTLSYTLPVRAVTCDSCGSSEVSQHRSYTPDLFYDGYGSGTFCKGYFIEIKGYLRAAQRSLLRAFCKARKDTRLRIIFQKDFPVSKTLSISQWTSRFLKIPYCIWAGKVPTEKEWKI